jgi:hypothetical protein
MANPSDNDNIIMPIDVDYGVLGMLPIPELAALIAAIYSGTLTITQPPANAIYQRDTRTGGLFGKGAGTIPITFTASEVITRLECRVRDYANPNTVLVDYTEIDFERVSGEQTVHGPAPAGLYRYLTDLRPNSDNQKVASTTEPVMMGEVRAFAGQSLAQEFIDTRPSADATTFTSLGLEVSEWAWIWAATALNSGAVPQVPDFGQINYPVTAWEQSSTTGDWKSAWAVQYQNQMIAETGVPCGLVGYAVGGTGIATWLPGYDGGGTPHWPILTEIISTAGGKFGGFLWCQGHYEARMLTAALTDTTAYREQIDLLFASLAEEYPGVEFFQVLSSIPAIGVYSGTTPITINQVRLVNKQYVADTADAAYVDGLDIELVADAVHYSQVGAITFANAWFRADAQKMGLATYGNDGPLITSAVRAYGSADIVLAVDQVNGGTAWVTSGSIANQFTVYPSGTTSGALTISSVNTSNPAQLVLTLSAPPTEPAALDTWPRISPDDATIIATTIRDNVTGDDIATGRQLALLGTPITAAVPVAVLTVATIASDDADTLIEVSGTYSNTILASGLEYSSDQGANWITATDSVVISAGNYSFDITAGLPVGVYELWVRDPISFGYGESNVFEMAQAAPATLPTIASPVFGMTAADGLATLWANTGRTTQAVIGGAVQGVTDVTASGNHFSQATATRAPIWQADIKNGLPGLYFDDTLFNVLNLISGATLGTTLKSSTGYTIFLVFTPENDAVNFTVFAAAEQAKSGGYNIIRGAQGLSTNAMRASRNSDTVYYQPSIAAATAANQLAKVVTRYDSAGSELAIAVNALSEATVVPGALGVNPFTAITIGAEGSNSITQFYLRGWVHEIRIWDSVASDLQRDNLLTYATSQWGS